VELRGDYGDPTSSSKVLLPEFGMLPIKALDLLNISVHLISTLPLLTNADMADTNAKLQDVVYLDTLDDETGTTFAGDRIALEKKLLRKIDTRMMPIMMLICTSHHSSRTMGPKTDFSLFIDVLNYLDRNNIAVARLGSFEKDLGLHGTQYNTIISIFFVGYILTQIPTNMILDKVRPSLFLPVIMCCWGAVSACSGAVQNYHGMIALRFLLGFVEALFFREYLCSCQISRI